MSSHQVEPVVESKEGQACYEHSLAIAEYRCADDHGTLPGSIDGFYDTVNRCLENEYSVAAVRSAAGFESLYLESPTVAMACFDHAYATSSSYAASGPTRSAEAGD